MKLLVINPNTTTSMTEAIANAARAVAAPGTEIVATQPSFGPASIEGHFDEAWAAAGVAEQAQLAETWNPAATILACFGDPGLEAARKRCKARCWALPKQPFTRPVSWPRAFQWSPP